MTEKEAESTTKEFTTRSGFTLEVDISNEACQKFGFNIDEGITDIHSDPGTIVGTAPLPELEDKRPCLWIAMDKDKGRIVFSSDPAKQLQKC